MNKKIKSALPAGILLPALSGRTVSIFEKVTSVVNNKTAFNSHDSSQNDKHGSDTEKQFADYIGE